MGALEVPLTFDEFRVQYKADPNFFWKLAPGTYMNLVDEALDRLNQTEITPRRLSEALQSAWNEWIADTHSIPGCFDIHGPSTTMLYADFTKEPNFTSSVVDHLRHLTPAIHPNDPEQSSIFVDNDDVIPDDIIAELRTRLAASDTEVERLRRVNQSWMDESESLCNTVYAMRAETDKWRDKYLNEVGVRNAAERSRDEAVATLIRHERGKSMLATVVSEEGPQGTGPSSPTSG